MIQPQDFKTSILRKFRERYILNNKNREERNFESSETERDTERKVLVYV